MPAINSERDEPQRNSQRDLFVLLAYEAVENVPSVELPNRKQVERRGKQSEPSGARHGIHQN